MTHSSLSVTGLTGWASDMKMKIKTAADISDQGHDSRIAEKGKGY